MLKKIIILSLFVLTQQLFAQTYIRYNMAGYYPERAKRLLVMSDVDLAGKNWNIKKDTSTILDGSIVSNFVGKGSYSSKAYNYEIDFTSISEEGEYEFTLETVDPITLKVVNDPYTFLIPEILKGIRARRSASNDAIVHKISHLGDEFCSIKFRVKNSNSSWEYDSNERTANMLGGWYDAGDYIKFTLTTAYTTYYLLKSYEELPDLFDSFKKHSTTDLNEVLDEANHGLKFLNQTMPENDLFIIQTAGYTDHRYGLRLPENDIGNGDRECYSALSKPQMGLTAAALSLGAKVLNSKGKTVDAKLYLQKAKDIYAKAKSSTESNTWWTDGNETFYADYSADDNMGLAAIELFYTTQDSAYFKDAITYSKRLGTAYWASWANVNMSFHNALLKINEQPKSTLIDDLTYFQQNFANATGNIWHTPHQSTWATLYSYFAVANNALDYQQNTADDTYEKMALGVIDYTLGLNQWGLGFVATKKMPSTISSSYAAIYRLQPDIFPTGEIAEGPTTASTHSTNEQWFSPKHDPTLWHKEFNTSNYTFFEEESDFVCMETTIAGLADGLYLFSLAGKMFAKDYNLGFTESKNHESIVFPNPFQQELHIQQKGNFKGTIRNMTGQIVLNFKSSNDYIINQKLEKGVYFLTLESNGKIETIKIIKD